jgi:hypothetical protein
MIGDYKGFACSLAVSTASKNGKNDLARGDEVWTKPEDSLEAFDFLLARLSS